MFRRTFAVIAALAAVLALPSSGLAAGKPPKAKAAAACTVQTYTYDNGGSPSSGTAVNDPLFPKQWGLDQINAPEAWARGATGSGVTIAIIDTGVDLAHPDLQSKLVTGVDIVAGSNDCPPGPQDEHARRGHRRCDHQQRDRRRRHVARCADHAGARARRRGLGFLRRHRRRHPLGG
jgi:hypothetical protein